MALQWSSIWRIAVVLGGILSSVLGACSTSPAQPDGGADAQVDAIADTMNDTTIAQDAPQDAVGVDAGAPCVIHDGGADGTVFNDFTSKAYWTSFDTTTLTTPTITGDAGSVGAFAGGAFDGRYVYFVPTNPFNKFVPTARVPYAVRLDTTAVFDASTSWEIFDVTTLPGVGTHTGFYGAAFDGRYVYFGPAGALSSVTARYDTQMPFQSPASWETAVVPSTVAGLVFDGRYLTFIAADDTSDVVRFDTTASTFDAGSAWQSAPLPPTDGGSFGAGAFDGRYQYFAQRVTGVMPRYDTQGPLDAGASWQTFDMTTIDMAISLNDAAPHFPNTAFSRSNAVAFDGRYVYPVGIPWELARFDSTSSYSSLSSWEHTNQLNSKVSPTATAGFVTGAFDGRYVYYVPFGLGNVLLAPQVMYRFDTWTDNCFDGVGPSPAWQSVEVIQFRPMLSSQGPGEGAVFDGRYLYLIADTVLRFDAKSPASLPPGVNHGSFF